MHKAQPQLNFAANFRISILPLISELFQSSHSRSSSNSSSVDTKKVVSWTDQKEGSSRPKETKRRSRTPFGESDDSVSAPPDRLKSPAAKKPKLKKKGLVKSSTFLDATNKDRKIRRNKVVWQEVAAFNSVEAYEESTVYNKIRYFAVNSGPF